MPAELGYHLHPEVIAVASVLLVGYGYALRRWGRLFHPRPDDPPVTRRQIAQFVGGVVVYLVAVGWPLHDLADSYLYSAHMVQHVLVGYLAPPLLLLGTPEWLARVVIGGGVTARIHRRLTRPVVAAVAFNATVAFIHWPLVVDVMLRSELAHVAIHLVFFATALIMWSVLWSPLPEVRGQLAAPGKMVYLFIQTLLPTVPASFLTFGTSPLYPAYAEMPRLLGLSPRDDMQLAGLIMKAGVGLVLWIVIAVMFFRWAAQEGALDPGGRRPPPGGPPGDGGDAGPDRGPGGGDRLRRRRPSNRRSGAP